MDINTRADFLVQKIRHLMITTSNHTVETATIEELYHACCLVFREEIMVHANATIDTIQSKKVRVVNFLSMEYLPGRLLGNNITNLNAMELVQAVLKKIGRTFSEIVRPETDSGLGNGGLGRLASCFLDSLATLQYPARGYGLRYQYGIFEQEIWDGCQVERPDCWLLNQDPWEGRRDVFALNVHFRGLPILAKNKHGDDVYLLDDGEEVRAIPFDTPVIGYSKNNNYSAPLLRLWSTKESPRNFQLQRYNAGFLDQAAENTSLTDVLYPNDNTDMGKRVRLKQEFLLVSASLQDIVRRHLKIYGDLSQFADKVRIQINDTHPALVIAEIIRILTHHYDFTWKEAWETCQTCCSYTNHTILKEALEEWNIARVQELLPRQLLVIERLNKELCASVRAKFPNDEEKVKNLSIIENGQIRMAHLAIYGSHKVNGVAKLHSKILRETIFKDFYDFCPEKFTNITNGVTQRRWLLHANPLLASFLSEKIGKEWITNFSEIAKIKSFASDSKAQEEFLNIKRQNKETLLKYLSAENFVRDSKGKPISHSHILNSNALFDVQIKRFHEYKRQLLNALHLIMLYQEPQPRKIPRLSVFGGKAAPGYKAAKQIIQLICAIGKKFHENPSSKESLCIAFVENYNVSKAELIIPATDLSEQISTAGWEASGTGNMKMAINGALTIGTEDGANIEMREAIGDQWWPFRFGMSAEENKKTYHPSSIYEQDEQIRNAVDTLKNGVFASSQNENLAFQELHKHLIEEDTFRVLQDLRSYYDTQKKVEELYLQPSAWAETAIHNIGGMGPFSTDVSIANYAKEIWQIAPCPPSPEILEKVQKEYSQYFKPLVC
jgi:starch phosphorylase